MSSKMRMWEEEKVWIASREKKRRINEKQKKKKKNNENSKEIR